MLQAARAGPGKKGRWGRPTSGELGGPNRNPGRPSTLGPVLSVGRVGPKEAYLDTLKLGLADAQSADISALRAPRQYPRDTHICSRRHFGPHGRALPAAPLPSCPGLEVLFLGIVFLRNDSKFLELMTFDSQIKDILLIAVCAGVDL